MTGARISPFALPLKCVGLIGAQRVARRTRRGILDAVGGGGWLGQRTRREDVYRDRSIGRSTPRPKRNRRQNASQPRCRRPDRVRLFGDTVRPAHRARRILDAIFFPRRCCLHRPTWRVTLAPPPETGGRPTIRLRIGPTHRFRPRSKTRDRCRGARSDWREHHHCGDGFPAPALAPAWVAALAESRTVPVRSAARRTPHYAMSRTNSATGHSRSAASWPVSPTAGIYC